MGSIVALGGGEIKEHETLPIDRRIVELTGKEDPRALFIPTASGDAEGYVDTFHKIYGEELGCETDVLCVVEESPGEEEIKEKIGGADLVYVGGGNTRKMIRLWEENGIDRSLRQAYEDGTVLSGLSAGAICWFEAGHSDSESFDGGDDWDYVRVDGLNLVEDIIFCPHYHFEDRVEAFREFMRDYPGKTGLAVDNGAALEIVDGCLRVVSVEEDSGVYAVFQKEGNIREERLDERVEKKLSEVKI